MRARRRDRRRRRWRLRRRRGQPELLHHGRHVEAKRFELLQQAEHDRRTRPRDASERRASAVCAAVALIDDDQLVDVAERRRHGAEDPARRLEDRRHLFEDGLQARRVVELLPRFGLAQDRGRFGDALRFDRLRLRETDRFDLRGLGAAFRFDRGRAAGAFLPQLLLLGLGERDQRRPPAFGFENRRLLGRLGAHDRRLPIGFGRLDDGRLELLLPAKDFLLLDRDQLLRPRPLDADFFGDDRLPRRGFRQRPGLPARAPSASRSRPDTAPGGS